MWAVLPPAATAGALVGLLAGLGGFAQAVLASAVVPDADLLARMGGAAIAAALGLAVPLGVLLGVAGGLARLREEGAWLGLRAAGLGGGALVGPVAAVLGVGVAAWLGVAHFVEPHARAALRDARVAAAVRVSPVEGRTLDVGDWSVSVDGGRLRFAGGEHVGSAARWSISPAQAGVLVRLEDGELRDVVTGAFGTFATLDAPLALGRAGKVHVSERATPDLLGQLATSAALGRDAYERWILWKRTLLPLALWPLGLAALPLVLGRRAPVAAVVGAQALTLWGAVRLADQAIGALGPPGAAVVTGLVALAWPALAWRGWWDR